MANYHHTFTLEEKPSRMTSSKARDAYEGSLEASGFRKYAKDGNGNPLHLPHSGRVGSFMTDQAASRAIDEAERAAEAADKGKFFVEASTLDRYEPIRTKGAPASEKSIRERIAEIMEKDRTAAKR